jgi:hypothetical protein
VRRWPGPPSKMCEASTPKVLVPLIYSQY